MEIAKKYAAIEIVRHAPEGIQARSGCFGQSRSNLLL